MTTKELRELFNSQKDDDFNFVCDYIIQNINNEYVLLDEDGFTMFLYYGKGHFLLRYVNRKKGFDYSDFIGVTDWKVEFLVFIGKIEQLFKHDLTGFQLKMMLEVDCLQKNTKRRGIN